jgi:hypothetical protein
VVSKVLKKYLDGKPSVAASSASLVMQGGLRFNSEGASGRNRSADQRAAKPKEYSEIPSGPPKIFFIKKINVHPCVAKNPPCRKK